MTNWVRIGRLDEFRPGRGRVVVVVGVRVAVFRVGSSVHAMRDACPHMGLSLAEAAPQDGRITCLGHGWSFDLGTGRSDRRSGACARIYDVRIEGGEVLVRPRADDGPAGTENEDWVVWDDARHGRRRVEDDSDRPSHGEERGAEADQDGDRRDDGGGAGG